MTSNDEIKMTNDEIKKALDLYKHTRLYITADKKEIYIEDALNLINQYEEKIKTLQKEKNKLMDAQMFLAKISDEQQAEVERLKKENEQLSDDLGYALIFEDHRLENGDFYINGKIKEFAERLKPLLFNYYDSDIDNLLKEMGVE